MSKLFGYLRELLVFVTTFRTASTSLLAVSSSHTPASIRSGGCIDGGIPDFE
eukprot:FN604926.1.p3 GENE.FN604926.1~~FN604926.1.p3  ORF type:complete len:52 (-),score=6.49 FN604926.1:10-165(-)